MLIQSRKSKGPPEGHFTVPINRIAPFSRANFILVERDGLPQSAHAGATDGFQVLASAPARLWETHDAPGGLHESYIGELNWVAERLGGGDTAANRARFEKGHAVKGTFRRGKGEVFTTSCTDWAYGLRCDNVAAVTRNLLRRCSRQSGTPR